MTKNRPSDLDQTAIPFIFMRGGTSRGPYFRLSDLPSNREELSHTLIHAVGAGQPANVDGIGGSVATTTKVAMLAKSEEDWADIDYHFAQVAVDEPLVDYKPSCGNMLSGVGPAAIEMGLMDAQSGETAVKIRDRNTGAGIEAIVQTPGGRVAYGGDAAIDGVNGTASPIMLKFQEVAGAITGSMLPTGKPIDTIDGFEVSCVDVAMPMCIGRAKDFGITGYESRDELEANRALFEKFEAVRLKAGEMMGLGDVTKSVVPKFALLAPAKEGGSFAARYFMPWSTHPTMAVTGAQCLASCALLPGSVATGLWEPPTVGLTTVTIEHASGTIDVAVEFERSGSDLEIRSTGILRTARKLADGHIFVPPYA